MTGMPQLVAALHSFVGLAAVFIGINSDINPPADLNSTEIIIHEIEIFLGIFIGAITFTGSIIAYGKISSRPILLPGRYLINLALLIAVIILGYLFVSTPAFVGEAWPLFLMALISIIFGIHMVLAIGGADMPIVVSMLNSYSGWAAVATGYNQ
jgi:NAD(P) transhydrogenase subunit beta